MNASIAGRLRDDDLPCKECFSTESAMKRYHQPFAPSEFLETQMSLGPLSLALIVANALGLLAILDEGPETSERLRLKDAEGLLKRLYAGESSKLETDVDRASSIIEQLIRVSERLDDSPGAERWRSVLAERAPKGKRVEGGSESDSVWSFLLQKYDRNENGEIEKSEYDRGTTAFSRLDINRDGLLSERDFMTYRGPGRGSPSGVSESMSLLMGQIVLATHFQTDDEDEVLRIEELEDSFFSFDLDESGEVDQEEFETESVARDLVLRDDVSNLFGKLAPFRLLLRAVDHDGDDSMTFKEIDSLYRHLDEDEDGAWEVISLDELMAGEEVLSQDKPDVALNAEGKKAPDFKLKSLQGENEVVLSSFAGNKPVALIFGSYT